MTNKEPRLSWIRKWRLQLGLLMAIIIPTITATGSYYDLKSDSAFREAKMNERVSALELSNQKEFADKNELHEMREDIRQVQHDISDMKNLLIQMQK